MAEAEIVAEIPYWEEKDLALICGIANAGGGTIVVLSGDKRGRTDTHRFRKGFESIPALSMQELSLPCSTEPVMNGTSLCLEVNVPAATEHVAFRGSDYLYSNGANKRIEKEHLEMIQGAANAEAPQDEGEPAEIPASKGRPTFKERSFAAANRLDMTTTDEYVLKVIEANGRVTAVRIADVLGVSESTVRRSFRKLRELELIERIGSDKAGYWRLVD